MLCLLGWMSAARYTDRYVLFFLSTEAYGLVVLGRERLGYTCIKADSAITISQYPERGLQSPFGLLAWPFTGREQAILSSQMFS